MHLRQEILNYLIRETRRLPNTYSIDAEDICQLTLISLIQRSVELKERFSNSPPTSIFRYAQVVARNILSESIRQERRIKDLMEVDKYIATNYDSENSISATVEDEAMLEAIDKIPKVVDSLPKLSQDIIRLKYNQGMVDSEISELLGISVSSVRSMRHKAMVTLRGLIHQNPSGDE